MYTVRHTCTRRTTGEDGLTALRREVTEQLVTGRGFTVARLFLLSQHPFHCWSVIPVPVRSQGNTLGREACCAERLPPSHHPFHCWTLFRRCSLSHFLLVMRPTQGYSLGLSTSLHHPFHCWSMLKDGYSQFIPEVGLSLFYVQNCLFLSGKWTFPLMTFILSSAQTPTQGRLILSFLTRISVCLGS